MISYPPIEQFYSDFLISDGVNTDSRTILPNQFFIALKGENFNGNKYAADALAKGALFAVVDEEEYAVDEQYILVEDGLISLQALATFHRQILDIPIIGITGSNGKTTTKELIAAVLSTKYNCFYTQGNLNNHIGVPLSILSIDGSYDIAVIEMGANHLGEIALLSNIAQPTHGLITNIGSAHIEGFGSKENVRLAKGELYDYISQTEEKLVFVNADDGVLMHMAESLNKVQYGKEGFVSGEILINEQFLKLKIEDEEQSFDITTHIVGDYNFYNALAATAVGRFFDIPLLDVAEAIEEYMPQNNRSQFLKKGDYNFIIDAYNANPSSMKAAIDHFAKQAGEKIAILGHMLELGDVSAEEHIQIAESLEELDLKTLLVGEQFKDAAKQKKIDWVKDAKAAKKWLTKNAAKNATILLKGSRGIKLEEIVED